MLAATRMNTVICLLFINTNSYFLNRLFKVHFVEINLEGTEISHIAPAFTPVFQPLSVSSIPVRVGTIYLQKWRTQHRGKVHSLHKKSLLGGVHSLSLTNSNMTHSPRLLSLTWQFHSPKNPLMLFFIILVNMAITDHLLL